MRTTVSNLLICGKTFTCWQRKNQSDTQKVIALQNILFKSKDSTLLKSWKKKVTCERGERTYETAEVAHGADKPTNNVNE